MSRRTHFAWLVSALLLPFLSGSSAVRSAAAPAPRKIPVLILTGQNNHNWRATTPFMRELLESTGRFEVRVNEEPTGCGPETFQRYDVLLLNYNGPRWGERAEAALLGAVRGGKGLVVVHAANNAFPGWDEYDRLIGGAWRSSAGHGRRHSFPVILRDRTHPITRDLTDFQHSVDELYHQLTMQPGIQLLATAFSSRESNGTGRDEPMAWVLPYGTGRVFHTVLGHDLEAMRGAGFAALLQRGTEWAATGAVTLPAPALPAVSTDGKP